MSKHATRPMTRRAFMSTAAGATLAAAACATRGSTSSSKPHILFLMVDQMRGDCLGAAENKVIETPHLDWLAREGARFACAYSTTPTCTPARAALLTGMSPWNHGMLGYHKVAEKYPVELPRAVREAGYHTLGIGKMHWHPQRNLHGFHNTILDESGRALSPGFVSDYRQWFASEAPGLDPDATGIGWNDYRAAPYVLPERLHPTVWTADQAVRFLGGFNGPEPFFLKVSFARPHSPYDPPQRWMDRYADADLPPARAGAWAERYRARSSEDFSIWHGDLGPEQVRVSRQGYYGSVSFIDEQIGRILQALDQKGWLDETLILFTSDHGDMTGDQHLWRKSYAYEPSAHIPMLLRWPGGMSCGNRGQVRSEPVELRDILPTVLDAAGGRTETPIDGQSLIGLCRGRTRGWRNAIDLEHDICYDPANHWTALTDGKLKYIFHARDGEEQLFNLVEDPGEELDLAGDPAHTDLLRRWRAQMVAHLEPRGNAWVHGNRPALRPESMKLSPNYPATA